MNVDLKNTSLPKFNQFFKAYGNFDVNKGSFGLFSEVAAKTGRFTGYVKPVIKDLDVLGPEDKDDKFGHKLWEGVIGFAGQIFKNQKKDQIATKVPLEGTFKKAETDIWYSIVVVLRNAFVEALRPSIDNEINIASVDNPPQEEKKGFLKKVFGKDDKKEKDSKRKDRKAKRDK